MGHDSPKLLILDIDETLIYATETPLTRSEDFHVGPYHVYKRPYVDAFLDQVFAWYTVAVWTTSTETYAAEIVRQLFPAEHQPTFVWSRERCTYRYNPELQESYWDKNLAKVKRFGYALESVIIVDDSPEKLQRSYGNLIRVRPYFGQEEDQELLLLLHYLERLRMVTNIRAIEKRGWRATVQRENDIRGL
jgi:Dullard-like phosphatase family protein